MNQSTSTPPIGPRETAAEIELAAAAWVARQDSGPLSELDREALERWTAADSRRAGAYARAMAINLHLDRVAALGENYVAQSGQFEAISRRRVMVVAASAVAALAVGIGIFTFSGREAGPLSRPFSTAMGATRQLALQEGSQITLNTMTQIRPEMTSGLRRVDLLQGEALFNVTKDPSRPFVVHAGNLSVRAVGTSFTVRLIGPDAIKVLVTQGIVEVSREGEILGRVHAGITFAVDSSASPVITNLDPVQVNSALLWRQGRLDLQGMTLAEAVEEFSRYSDLKIEVEDPSIANLRITGIYSTKDPEGFAENVALSLGLRSVRRGNVVKISRS